MLEHVEILKEIVTEHVHREHPVSRPLRPEELARQIDIPLGPEGAPISEVQKALEAFVAFSPDVSQTAFHKQLYSGRNENALLGEWVASFTNSVMHTYKMGPVATLMELEVIRQFNRLVGFTDGDGIMVSGASQANLIAMMLARYRHFPQVYSSGYDGRVLTAFVSDQAHYSMQRAANILGIGDNNLRRVKSGPDGRLDPADLKQQIAKSQAHGEHPFFIGLTAGTTILGAFDPVLECHAIAREHDLWLHIDGAWGAPVLFSEKHRALLEGNHLADSFTWDAHKFLNVPLTAGIILVREAGLMRQAISGGGGDYLFHGRDDRDPNLGEMSIQSARRADALKVWAAWKSSGARAFEEKMDHLLRLKRKLVTLIEQDDRFQLLAPAPFLNILFQYRPAGGASQATRNKLTMDICDHLASSGEAFIDYARFRGDIGIRLVLANADVTESYLQELLEKCARCAEEMLRKAA